MKSKNWFRKRAYELYHREGQLEVDDNAPVSIGDDDGAYVQAWVWVYGNEASVRGKPEHLAAPIK